MGRGTKMTPQQKGKRSKGEFAIIPFLDFMDSVDMVDMKIAFPIFPFSHHDIFHKNRDRSSTKEDQGVPSRHGIPRVLVILLSNIWAVFDQ